MLSEANLVEASGELGVPIPGEEPEGATLFCQVSHPAGSRA